MRDWSGVHKIWDPPTRRRCPCCDGFIFGAYSGELSGDLPFFHSWRQQIGEFEGVPHYHYCPSTFCDLLLLFSRSDGGPDPWKEKGYL